MNINTALEELRAKAEPYLFFWKEWSQHEACFLNPEEIYALNIHFDNDFKPPLFDRFMFYNRPAFLSALSHKLWHRFHMFQEWVIFKFLCVVITLAKAYGTEAFLLEPVEALQIPAELKRCLSAFKIHHVRQLALAYKVNDFKRSWVYALVMDFHRVTINSSELHDFTKA